MVVARREQRQWFGRVTHLSGEPIAFVFPLQLPGCESRRTVPAQPHAIVSRCLHRLHKSLAGFLKRPVVSAAVVNEIRQAVSDEMFGCQITSASVVHQHSGKWQMRPAK